MGSDAKQQEKETMHEAILKMAAMAPPGGQVSNLVNPDSRKGLTVALLSLSMTLSSLFVIARMYTKLFIIRKVHKEDCEIRVSSLSQLCVETSFG